jgi:hypothetical protein
VVGGYRLVTLRELAREAGSGTPLVQRNAWLSSQDIQQDIRAAVFPLTDQQQTEYDDLAREYRQVGDSVLAGHCAAEGIGAKTLSIADAKALAVASDFDAVLATDEWPLRLVATKVERDDGTEPVLFSSLDLLLLLEKDGKLARDERVAVVKDWLRVGEKLLSTWRDDYQRLFGEAAPTVQ